MPCRALRPVATRTAIGAASPMAQGQATTSTATPRASAKSSAPSLSSQAAIVRTATAMTAGTKTPATRSAARWMGIFSVCAFRTAAAIRDTVLSAAGRVTSISAAPVRFIAPATTPSETVRSTGTLSPVRSDSSIAAPPRTILPSSGTRSPGRTRTCSPRRTSATGTRRSTPSRTTRARSGAKASSSVRASVARPRARSSSQRPRRTMATISAAVSKNSIPAPPAASATTEEAYAAPAPSPIRLSMPNVQLRSELPSAFTKAHPKSRQTGVASANWTKRPAVGSPEAAHRNPHRRAGERQGPENGQEPVPPAGGGGGLPGLCGGCRRGRLHPIGTGGFHRPRNIRREAGVQGPRVREAHRKVAGEQAYLRALDPREVPDRLLDARDATSAVHPDHPGLEPAVSGGLRFRRTRRCSGIHGVARSIGRGASEGSSGRY